MRTLILGLIGLGLAGCVSFDVDLGGRRGDYREKVVEGDASLDAKIALIDIEGVISNEQEESLFSSKESQIVALVDKLRMAEEDPNVKAVILRVDSPGGDVTTSDLCYNELLAFKNKKKVPVVAAFMGLAASGGYYLACASDTIVALPTTVTGSIGVISMHFSLAGLLDNPDLRAELGANAREWVARDRTWAHNAARYREAYERLGAL